MEQKCRTADGSLVRVHAPALIAGQPSHRVMHNRGHLASMRTQTHAYTRPNEKRNGREQQSQQQSQQQCGARVPMYPHVVAVTYKGNMEVILNREGNVVEDGLAVLVLVQAGSFVVPCQGHL